MKKDVIWRKSFKKDFIKLGIRQQIALAKVISLFITNSYDKKLRRHKLMGKYKGLESLDVTPDLRAIFAELEDKFVFYYLKNHNQLYS